MSGFPMLVKKRLFETVDRLERQKQDLVKNPEKDFTRNRKLSFQTLLKLMLSMGGKSLGSELLEHFDFDLKTASSSAFIQQRSKLSPEVFKVLLHAFTDSFDQRETYEGYRLVAIDGSDLLIPHDPNHAETYFQSIPNTKGFNLIHINAMYDLINRIYLDASVQPGRKENEFKALNDMVDISQLDEPVLIVADRGYESYNAFAHIMEKGWKFLIRVKDPTSKSMLGTFDLPDAGEFDRQIHRILTRKQTNEIKARPDVYKFMPMNSTFDFMDPKAKPFYPMSFRVVRVILQDGSSQCFVTNLDKDEFTLEKIREIYHMRWGIETSFREIKHTLALTHLHSKKVEFIAQEVFAKMVMYNFCSIITSHVVIEQKLKKHGYQVNFSKAITICRHFLKIRNDASPPDLEALIQKFILPIRPGRSNPRKIRFRTFVSFTYRLA